MAQPGPQPDFALLAQGFQQVATQLGNFANLRPIVQDNAIVQQLQQIQQEQQQFQQQMQQQIQQFQQQTDLNFANIRNDTQQLQQQTDLNFADVRNDIQNLRNDLRISRQASEHNSIARIENSGVKKSTTPLTVFRDYTTNTDIPEFPATPANLENMRAVTLDPILRSLGLSLHGDIGDRRQRFGHYIGLTNLAQ